MGPRPFGRGSDALLVSTLNKNTLQWGSDGCDTRPGTHYFKPLGMPRLIQESEQHFGNQAFRRMERDSFVPLRKADRKGLIQLFLRHYPTTSIHALWNRGGGFHKKDGSKGERQISDWLAADNIAYLCDKRFRILGGYAVRPDFYLPNLDADLEYWGTDTAEYKIGTSRKQPLFQQECKRLISIYPTDRPRIDSLLGAKLTLSGRRPAAPDASDVGEQK